MAQQLKVITQKIKAVLKKDPFKQKTIAESNSEREEHGIAPEERVKVLYPSQY